MINALTATTFGASFLLDGTTVYVFPPGDMQDRVMRCLARIGTSNMWAFIPIREDFLRYWRNRPVKEASARKAIGGSKYRWWSCDEEIETWVGVMNERVML